MASAAAVAADAALSPLPDHEYDPKSDTVATIKSIDERSAKSDDNENEDENEDDDEDDIAPTSRRRKAASRFRADSDDEAGDDEDEAPAPRTDQKVGVKERAGRGIEGDEDGSDDADKELFGEGTDEDEASPRPRGLDDEELDSGDDLAREDRRMEEDEFADEAPVEQELTFMDVELGRHPVPRPSDGELYLMKVPRFLGIEPHAFDPKTFQPPTTDHHSKTAASDTFSAYNTAMSTIRWRHSPSDPSKLQSNARVLRWSDGSLTLQLAANPTVQYLMPGGALSQPQVDPPKPTPTSIRSDQRKPGQKKHKYNSEKDSFTYLVAPNERSQVLRITNKFTANLQVQAATNAADDALERLQNSLAAAVRGPGDDDEGNGMGIIQLTEDPELAKKKAEVAEKEKQKALRRRETQEARERERGVRPFGRRGGLTAGGLEDELGMGASGRRGGGGGGARRPKPRRSRHGEIYSDDEDEEYGRRGRTREDEYDKEDDFVVGSDEEEEEVFDDDDEEEDDDDGIVEDKPSVSRSGQKASRASPKRSLDDAEGEPDDNDDGGPAGAAAGSPQARGKRRRVIDEDDEE